MTKTSVNYRIGQYHISVDFFDDEMVERRRRTQMVYSRVPEVGEISDINIQEKDGEVRFTGTLAELKSLVEIGSKVIEIADKGGL